MNALLPINAPSQEDKQCDLPFPFILRFLEHASASADDVTAGGETPYKTGLDNKFVDDTMEDEDIDEDASPKTGVIADSDNKEDEDY